VTVEGLKEGREGKGGEGSPAQEEGLGGQTARRGERGKVKRQGVEKGGRGAVLRSLRIYVAVASHATEPEYI
jgi:hypothetical protein